jgi:hypothetical protein
LRQLASGQFIRRSKLGIELLLGIVVFPIAQKVGEKWIDRIATGIDQYSIEILKQVVSDPSREQEAKEYFRNNPEAAGKLEQNIAITMQADDTIASLAATVVPPRGAKLPYYASLVRWVVQSGSKLGQHVVLKGFLNGELCLSYFIFDADRVENEQILNIVNDRYIDVNRQWGVTIRIQPMGSEEERDEKFKAINNKVRDSKYGKLEREDYKDSLKIATIYEHYVMYDSAYLMDVAKRLGSGRDARQRRLQIMTGAPDINVLPSTLQEDLRITTYTPIPLMIQSVGELVEDRAKDIENLRRAIMNASP